jgi:hypothetical protein
MKRSRRGGEKIFTKTVKLGNTEERLKAANKTLDELVLKHIDKDELKTLCRLWDVKHTGSPEYDSKALLKIFHGYPNFARDTMAIVASHVVFLGGLGGYFAGMAVVPGAAILGTLWGLSTSLKHWSKNEEVKIYKDTDKIEATAALLNRAIDRLADRVERVSARKSSTKSNRKSSTKSASKRKGGR